MGYAYAFFIGMFIGVMIRNIQIDRLRDKVKKLEDMKGITWVKKPRR